MTKDLTAGKPLKSIILFMLPIMVGNIFQQLYSMVDTIIVGQTISNQALAGVGVTNSMSLLIIGFVQGLTSGFSVKTSQCFGARDEEGVKKSLAASLALSTVPTPTVRAVLGTLFTSLSKKRELAMMVSVVSVFWRVRDVSDEPGSLKAICPSGPIPPMKRSTPP